MADASDRDAALESIERECLSAIRALDAMVGGMASSRTVNATA
jgi:hypothetical protein